MKYHINPHKRASNNKNASSLFGLSSGACLVVLGDELHGDDFFVQQEPGSCSFAMGLSPQLSPLLCCARALND